MREPVIAEFESVEAIVRGAERVRALGYADVEAYTPFPIPALARALGTRRSRLPFLIFAMGLTGTTLAYLVEWGTNAFDYRLDVGGRPYNSIPSDIPIMFETTVLLAAFAAFFGALLFSGLPRLHHRLFELEGFERTTIDRFWIIVSDARVARPDVAAEELASLRQALLESGAVAVRDMEASEP